MHGQPFNKQRIPNPVHVWNTNGGGAGEPPFSGLVTISSTERGGATGLWDLDLVLQDSGGSPLPSTTEITLTFKDFTNSVTIASATYNVGDIIGADAPSSESGNWTSDIVPFLTGVAVQDGATIGFTLYDYLLQDVDDLFSNLVRTFQFCLVADPSGEAASSEDSANVDYSFFKAEYTTTKSGTHQTKVQLDLAGYSLIDWGDTQTAAAQITTSTTTLQATYADSSAKTVRIAIPSASNITVWQQFTQSITSFEEFDLSSCVQFRVTSSSSLTSLPAFDFGAVTYLDLKNNGFTTLSGSLDVSSVVTMRLDGNNLTSLPSGWDVSSVENLYCYNNNLTALPSGWNTVSMDFLNASSNNLTTLPSGWNTAALETLDVSFNNISSLPSGWTTTALSYIQVRNNTSLSAFPASWTSNAPIEQLYIQNTGFSSIPSFDFSACTVLDASNCASITSIGSAHNFASMVTFTLNGSAITSWNQTAISTSVTTFSIFNNSLAQSEIDDVLSQLKTSYNTANRVIVSNMTGNTAPSAAGIVDRDYLNTNGCTITTD